MKQIIIISIVFAITVAAEQELAKCKMRPAADIAAWRGIVFGTNWYQVDDMRLVRAELNPWPYAGLQAGMRTSEPFAFGGVPVESIMYCINGKKVIGVRLIFNMRHYQAILAKCRAALGPTGARDDLLCWQGANLLVMLCKYHTTTSGLLDAVSAKEICKMEKHAKTESMREFQ